MLTFLTPHFAIWGLEKIIKNLYVSVSRALHGNKSSVHLSEALCGLRRAPILLSGFSAPVTWVFSNETFLVCVHAVPFFGTLLVDMCPACGVSWRLRGAVWLVLTGVRRDGACLLGRTSVCLFLPCSVHAIQLNGEKSPEDLGESEVTGWVTVWSVSSHRPALDFMWVGNHLIVPTAAWLGASPSQQHLSWLCHLILNSSSSLLHFSL